MNPIVWLITLLLLGLLAGWGVGALLAFTGGRTRYDLSAGLLGAVAVAVPFRLSGLTGFGAALPSLIAGLSGAMLAAWLTRIATWQAEPAYRPENEPVDTGDYRRHDLMTTSDGTRLLLSSGRLVVPELTERTAQPTAPA